MNSKDCLEYYSRKEILTEIVKCSKNKEIGIMFEDGHFGKRPDVIINNEDVIELARQGVVSFHVSEEHWKNPMQLSLPNTKDDLDKLRTGWDLILDIDCPSWILSKRICHIIIEILKKHEVKSIFCKFSGNKGFHVGIPFSSFPKTINDKKSELFFPDGVKKILKYIVYCIKKDYTDFLLDGFNLKEIAKELNIETNELFKEFCIDCGEVFNIKNKLINYNCPKCGNIHEKEEYFEAIACEKCGFGFVKPELDKEQTCSKCKSKSIKKEINIELIIGLDNILISSRHLYRMPFSLHEKSGLVSLPISIDNVLSFEKEFAKPNNIKKNLISFLNNEDCFDLNNNKIPDAEFFLFKALSYDLEIINFENYLNKNDEFNFKKNNNGDLTNLNKKHQKIPVECFPPCILNILKGISDGKKRALFVLLNFLDCMYWENEEIEKTITEWNRKNTPPLAQNLIITHLNYKKNSKEKVLPPNYSNNIYYSDIGILSKEEQSGKIKNPVTYAIRKHFFLSKENKQTKTNEKQ